MSGNISDRDKKELCLKSGNRCALPNCPQLLVIDDPGNKKNSVIAVMAHINGEKPGAARYDPKLPEENRNIYNNLILVCPNCHKIIDDQEHTYTVEYLLDIKQKHEKWILTRTRQEMPNVTFAELAEVMHYLSSSESPVLQSFNVIPPKDKLSKNHLSSQIEGLLVMGLTKAAQTKEYLNSHHDILFADRLVTGFVKEYNRLKYVEQMETDELFLALLDFAADHRTEFIYKAAGLTVLSYLFEKCEVFEK